MNKPPEGKKKHAVCGLQASAGVLLKFAATFQNPNNKSGAQPRETTGNAHPPFFFFFCTLELRFICSTEVVGAKVRSV